MIKIWHFSDTHTYHNLLTIPDVDIAIFSGDCSNPRDPSLNNNEVRNFIEWYGSLKIPHKIAIGGNHDTSIEKRLVTPGDFAKEGIIYLENNSTEVLGLKIWGSPITPEFGIGWAWNRKREKIYKVWDNIPDNTDIIVTHGPPKTIMDLSYDTNHKLEFCGCSNLLKRIFTINPKAVLFGHIHNCNGVINAGIRQIPDLQTIFSNGSVLTDGKFGVLSSNGNIIEV
jgi:Icc-related predicted phosphoesterase